MDGLPRIKSPTKRHQSSIHFQLLKKKKMNKSNKVLCKICSNVYENFGERAITLRVDDFTGRLVTFRRTPPDRQQLVTRLKKIVTVSNRLRTIVSHHDAHVTRHHETSGGHVRMAKTGLVPLRQPL